MPDIGIKGGAPLGLSLNSPLESWVAGSGSTGVQSVLQLSEVGFEEVNLMLQVGAGSIGVSSLDREVVVDTALVDWSAGLWNQLGTSHVLTVPVSSSVNGDLDTLVGGGVCWILVAWGEVDILSDGLRSVDIVLVWADLVGPRPVVEVCAR